MNCAKPTCAIHLQALPMFPLDLCTVTIDVPEIRASFDHLRIRTDTI